MFFRCWNFVLVYVGIPRPFPLLFRFTLKSSTGCFKKNATMFVCLISPEPMNRFLNRFFLLKTEIHMKILNTEPILCDFRGLRYLQNKTGFWNRQVHIHTDLKWSSQHQSGFEMPRLAIEWPGHPLRDQLGQLGAP